MIACSVVDDRRLPVVFATLSELSLKRCMCLVLDNSDRLGQRIGLLTPTQIHSPCLSIYYLALLSNLARQGNWTQTIVLDAHLNNNRHNELNLLSPLIMPLIKITQLSPGSLLHFD